MTFPRIAWALPIAYAMHVAEEAPGFRAWARRNASERYTQRDFVRNDLFGLASTIAATVLVTHRRSRTLDLAYYTRLDWSCRC